MARNPYANFEPVPHQPQQAPEGIAEFRRNLQESFHNGTPRPFLHVNELDDASLTHLSTADIHNLSDVEIMNTPHEVLKRLPDDARTTWLGLRQAVIEKYTTMSPADLNEEIKHQPGLVDSLQGDIEELLPHATQEALDRVRHQTTPRMPIFGRRRSRQANQEGEKLKAGKERLVVIESDLLATKLGEGNEVVLPTKSEPIVPTEKPVHKGNNDPGNWLLERFDDPTDDNSIFYERLAQGDFSSMNTTTVSPDLAREALQSHYISDKARRHLEAIAAAHQQRAEAERVAARYRTPEAPAVASGDVEVAPLRGDEMLVPEGTERLDPSRPQTDVVGNLTHRNTVETAINAPNGASIADLNTAHELHDALVKGVEPSSLTTSTVSETAASTLLDLVQKGGYYLPPSLRERLELIVGEHRAMRERSMYAPAPKQGSFVDKIKGIRSSLRAYFGLDTAYFDFGAEQKPDKTPEKAPQTGPSFKEDAIAFVSGHIKSGEWMKAGKKWVGDLKIGDTLKSVTLPSPPKIKVPKVALPEIEWKEAFDKADKGFERAAKVAVGVGSVAVEKVVSGAAFAFGSALAGWAALTEKSPEGRKRRLMTSLFGVLALGVGSTAFILLMGGDTDSHHQMTRDISDAAAPSSTGVPQPSGTGSAASTTQEVAQPSSSPKSPDATTPPPTTTPPPDSGNVGGVESPKPPAQPPVNAEAGTQLDPDSNIWNETKEYLEAHGFEATDGRIDFISDTRRQLMGNLSEFDAAHLAVGTKLPTFNPAELARLVEEADKLSAK